MLGEDLAADPLREALGASWAELRSCIDAHSRCIEQFLEDSVRWPQIPHGSPTRQPCGPPEDLWAALEAPRLLPIGLQAAIGQELPWVAAVPIDAAGGTPEEAGAASEANKLQGRTSRASSINFKSNNTTNSNSDSVKGVLARSPSADGPPMGQKKSRNFRTGGQETLFEEDEDALHAALHRSKEALRVAEQRTQPLPPKPWTVRLVHSTVFELVMAAAVMSNVALIGIDVQWQAGHVGQPDSPAADVGFYFANLAYTLLFLLELILRLTADGFRKYYCTPGAMWAYLDSFIVVSSVLEALLDALAMVGAGSSRSFGNVTQLRILRMIRMMRLVRTFRIQRVIRMVAPLRTLVYSIVVTLKSLMWAMVLLLIIMYVVGIVFTQGAVDALNGGGFDDDEMDNLREYWASLDSSMFTLYQSVTNGVNWRDPVMVLEKVSYFMSWLFTLFVTFVYFAVLNVVTGVFCSCAIETTQRNPEIIANAMLKNKQTYIENLKSLFMQVDEDSSGLITLREFENLLNNDLMNAHLVALEIDTNDAWTLFKLIDQDKSGVIEIDEFVRGCEQLKGSAKGLDVANMTAEFRLLAKKLLNFMRHAEVQFEILKGLPADAVPHVSVHSALKRPDHEARHHAPALPTYLPPPKEAV